jgi:hypothetical protein
MSEKFDPDQLSKRVQALKKKQAAAKKQRVEEEKRIKLAASISLSPNALNDMTGGGAHGYLPPPDDYPAQKSSALLRKQRQRLNRHRGKQAAEAIVWFLLAALALWWCMHQLSANTQPLP